MTQNPSISPTYSMKRYLKWTDSDIKENRAWVRKDAAFMWEIEKIKGEGPNFREQGNELDAAIADLQGGAGSLSSQAGTPPEFGIAPESTPETPEASPETPSTAPETGDGSSPPPGTSPTSSID